MVSKKRKLQNEASKLWKNACILKYGGKCEVCGDTFMVTPHHYYYRSGYGHLKYDLENGIILCRKCHFALHFGKDPKKIEDRIREVRGRKWENRLFKKSKEKHYSYQTIDYYNKIIKQLQKL